MAIDVTTIAQDVFSVIQALLVANKPSYDISGTTVEYSIVAEYGGQNTDFPYIVLVPAIIEAELLSCTPHLNHQC